MKRVLVLAVVAIMIGFGGLPAQAWFIDFEDGADGAPVVGIPGIDLQDFNGHNPVYGDTRTGYYNTKSDDLGIGGGAYHHYGNLWVWAGSAADARGVKVDFTNNDGTFFTTGYSSYATFYVDAYLTDGNVVTVSGPGNVYSPMEFLTVNATPGAFIDFVILHDTGNYWLVDNMSGDASGVNEVPEPSSLLLLGGGIVWVARRMLTREVE